MLSRIVLFIALIVVAVSVASAAALSTNSEEQQQRVVSSASELVFRRKTGVALAGNYNGKGKGNGNRKGKGSGGAKKVDHVAAAAAADGDGAGRNQNGGGGKCHQQTNPNKARLDGVCTGVIPQEHIDADPHRVNKFGEWLKEMHRKHRTKRTKSKPNGVRVHDAAAPQPQITNCDKDDIDVYGLPHDHIARRARCAELYPKFVARFGVRKGDTQRGGKRES